MNGSAPAHTLNEALHSAFDIEVLMSFQEKWAKAILNRTKRWEFRRKCGLSRGMLVWIYVTAPRCEIVGFFTIGEIRCVSARRPDPILAGAGAVTPAELRIYFKDLDCGFTIEVTRLRRLERPVRLSKGRSGPQSYRFLYPDGPDHALVRRMAQAA
jgi:predicted transcriptional regulator